MPAIGLLIISVCLSTIVAYYAHNQPFYLTFYEQRPVYYFLFYFVLHYFRFTRKELERLLLILGLVYASLYIFQRVVYPYRLLNVKYFWDRGTLRIFLPGFDFLIISFFYLLNRFREKFEVKNLVFISVFLLTLVFSGTRQFLVAILFLSLVYLVFARKLKYRFIIFAGMVLGMIFFFYRYGDIARGLIEATNETRVSGDENIRVLAAKFFIKDFYSNKLAYLLGNGEYTVRSPYGLKMLAIGLNYRFYLSDIGIIGAYVKFGLIFALTSIYIILRTILFRLNKNIIYIKYFMGFILLTMLTSTVSFEGSEGAIVLCSIFYLIDLSKVKIEENQGDKQYLTNK